MEAIIGDVLQDVGYEPVTSRAKRRASLPTRIMRSVYPFFWDLKLWVKTYTPLARTADIGRMGISDRAPADSSS
jgi:hypothetical protein